MTRNSYRLCPPKKSMASEYRRKEKATNDIKKKLAANRKNAQLSAGSKETSKSRYNAIKHGISSEQAIVPAVDGPDSTERFNAILDRLRQGLDPQRTLESCLLDQIAMALQQQKRLLAYENAVIHGQVEAAITRWSGRSQVDRAIVEMEAALNQWSGNRPRPASGAHFALDYRLCLISSSVNSSTARSAPSSTARSASPRAFAS